jgi:hypothetical protein
MLLTLTLLCLLLPSLALSAQQPGGQTQWTQISDDLFVHTEQGNGLPQWPTTGDQHALVLPFSFQDNPGNQPWSLEQINTVLTGVRALYKRASFDKYFLSWDLMPWFTIPANSTDCTANITALANAYAASQGEDPDSDLLTHVIYIFPSGGCHSPGGTTYVSSNSSGFFKTWIFISGLMTPRTMTHEIGHTITFGHANTYVCSGTTLCSNGTQVDYGDYYDVMGQFPNISLPGNPFRDLAGWYINDPRQQVVTAPGGTYTLHPIELVDSSLHSLKIFKAQIDATTVRNYYLEFRYPYAQDAPLAAYPQILNGVLLKYLDTSTVVPSAPSYLLDCTPATSSFDQALHVGATFSDPSINLTIHCDSVVIGTSVVNSTATVTITK